MATGAAYFGAIPLVLGDLKPDYPDLIRALGGEVISLGRGRGYINPLDMTVTHEAVKLLDSGAGHLDDQERAKLRAELLSDARGRRLAMISALATLQRHGPLSDHEDTILGVALSVLDEHHRGRAGPQRPHPATGGRAPSGSATPRMTRGRSTATTSSPRR